jgi:hypothetical protein
LRWPPIRRWRATITGITTIGITTTGSTPGDMDAGTIAKAEGIGAGHPQYHCTTS